MKVIKKILVVLLVIIMTGVFLVFNFSFSGEKFIVKYGTGEAKTKIKENMIENLDISNEKIDEFVNNKEVEALMEKYINAYLKGYTSDVYIEQLDLTSDINSFIDKNHDFLVNELKMSEEELNKYKDSQELKELTEKVKNSLKEDREDNEEMVAFSRIYTKVSSLEFKLILGGIILGIAILIFLLTKDIGKVIKDMGISLVVGAIIFGTLVLILNFLIEDLNLGGNVIMSTLMFSIITLIVGILFIILGVKLKKKVS